MHQSTNRKNTYRVFKDCVHILNTIEFSLHLLFQDNIELVQCKGKQIFSTLQSMYLSFKQLSRIDLHRANCHFYVNNTLLL